MSEAKWRRFGPDGHNAVLEVHGSDRPELPVMAIIKSTINGWEWEIPNAVPVVGGMKGIEHGMHDAQEAVELLFPEYVGGRP